jgi:hypothetical protein
MQRSNAADEPKVQAPESSAEGLLRVYNGRDRQRDSGGGGEDRQNHSYCVHVASPHLKRRLAFFLSTLSIIYAYIG